MRRERRPARDLAGAVLRRHPRSARLARIVSPRACVLTYHRVAAVRTDPFGQAVAPDNFRRQLAWLRERYRVIAVPELLRELAHGTCTEQSVAVTFDDGYADTLTAAAPIAAEADVPLHVFVAVGPVLEGVGFWWDDLARTSAGRDVATAPAAHAQLKALPAAERSRRLGELAADASAGGDLGQYGRPLAPAELDELAAAPHVSIGSHTLSHPCLAALGRAEQLHELRASREALERRLGLPVSTLSYPFGKEADIAADTPGLARSAGYDAAFTSTGRPLTPGSDRLTLSRVTVHDWDEATFRGRVRGVFGY